MAKMSDCEYGLGRGLREAYPSTGAFTVAPALRRVGQPLRQEHRREGDRLICDTYAGDKLIAHQEVTVAQAQADIAKAEAMGEAILASNWAEPTRLQCARTHRGAVCQMRGPHDECRYYAGEGRDPVSAAQLDAEAVVHRDVKPAKCAPGEHELDGDPADLTRSVGCTRCGEVWGAGRSPEPKAAPVDPYERHAWNSIQKARAGVYDVLRGVHNFDFTRTFGDRAKAAESGRVDLAAAREAHAKLGKACDELEAAIAEHGRKAGS